MPGDDNSETLQGQPERPISDHGRSVRSPLKLHASQHRTNSLLENDVVEPSHLAEGLNAFSSIVVGWLVLGLVIAVFATNAGSGRRRRRNRTTLQKRLATERQSETKTHRTTLTGPEPVVEAVANYLSLGVARVRGMPLLAEDSLAEVFGVYTPDGPSIDHVVQEICHSLNLDPDMPPDTRSPRTVGELVALIAHKYQPPPE